MKQLHSSETRDGMRIDVYDDRHVQTADNDPAQRFEAGWTEHGAVCVAHPRVKANGSLADLGKAIPRLTGRLGADVCTEESARAQGAVLFNRSAP